MELELVGLDPTLLLVYDPLQLLVQSVWEEMGQGLHLQRILDLDLLFRR